MQFAREKVFQGKRVFLTGHTGFKGTWMTMWLHHLGAHVTGYALPPPSKPSHFVIANVESCLVRHHEGAWPVLGLERADGTRRQHLPNADRAQRPEVGTVVHAMWREAMTLPVAGEEGHRPALDLTDHHIVAGGSEGRLDAEVLRVGQKRVEP